MSNRTYRRKFTRIIKELNSKGWIKIGYNNLYITSKLMFKLLEDPDNSLWIYVPYSKIVYSGVGEKEVIRRELRKRFFNPSPNKFITINQVVI